MVHFLAAKHLKFGLNFKLVFLKGAAKNLYQGFFISTLGARGFSCAVSGVGHVSIVTRPKNLWSRARFL